MKTLVDAGHRFSDALEPLNAIHGCINSDEWIIHAFEPNPAHHPCPYCADVQNILHHKEAVWIEDGIMDFHQTPSGKVDDKKGGGCCLSTFTPKGPILATVPVKTINFSEFIECLECEELMVKMDIEGAEYPVLRKMIEDGTIGRIDHLYVETHQRLLNDEDSESTAELLNSIVSAGVKVHLWH